MADKKATAEDIRAARMESDALFRMSKDSLYDTLVNGPKASQGEAPSGFVDPAAARKARMIQATGKADGPADVHMDWDSVLSQMNPAYAQKAAKRGGYSAGKTVTASNPHTISLNIQSRLMDKFSPLLEEVNRFKFASDSKKREHQMKTILASIKTAVNRMACDEVIENTRAAYDNATNFFKSDQGVRIVFKVAKVDVSVGAYGDFSGDEIICLEVDGTNATPYVVRESESGVEDLTSNFDIQMKVVK